VIGEFMDRKINFEDETIEIGDWKTRDNLKDDIKVKVGEGDFDVVDEALALKQLTNTLSDYEEIIIKLPTVFVSQHKKEADNQGMTLCDLIRTLLLE